MTRGTRARIALQMCLCCIVSSSMGMNLDKASTRTEDPKLPEGCENVFDGLKVESITQTTQHGFLAMAEKEDGTKVVLKTNDHEIGNTQRLSEATKPYTSSFPEVFDVLKCSGTKTKVMIFEKIDGGEIEVQGHNLGAGFELLYAFYVADDLLSFKHKDVKPDNILERTGDGPRCYKFFDMDQAGMPLPTLTERCVSGNSPVWIDFGESFVKEETNKPTRSHSLRPIYHQDVCSALLLVMGEALTADRCREATSYLQLLNDPVFDPLKTKPSGAKHFSPYKEVNKPPTFFRLKTNAVGKTQSVYEVLVEHKTKTTLEVSRLSSDDSDGNEEINLKKEKFELTKENKRQKRTENGQQFSCVAFKSGVLSHKRICLPEDRDRDWDNYIFKPLNQ